MSGYPPEADIGTASIYEYTSYKIRLSKAYDEIGRARCLKHPVRPDLQPVEKHSGQG